MLTSMRATWAETLLPRLEVPLVIDRLRHCNWQAVQRATGSSTCAHHHEGDVGVDALPLDGVLHRDDGRLRALRVLRQRALHLRCAYPVPAHVDHIIHAACREQLPCSE